MMNDINIDINEVIKSLSLKIASLEIDNSILEAKLKAVNNLLDNLASSSKIEGISSSIFDTLPDDLSQVDK